MDVKLMGGGLPHRSQKNLTHPLNNLFLSQMSLVCLQKKIFGRTSWKNVALKSRSGDLRRLLTPVRAHGATSPRAALGLAFLMRAMSG